MICRLAIPQHRLRVILRHPLTVGVHLAQRTLCLHITGFRRLYQLLRIISRTLIRLTIRLTDLGLIHCQRVCGERNERSGSNGEY